MKIQISDDMKNALLEYGNKYLMTERGEIEVYVSIVFKIRKFFHIMQPKHAFFRFKKFGRLPVIKCYLLLFKGKGKVKTHFLEGLTHGQKVPAVEELSGDTHF